MHSPRVQLELAALLLLFALPAGANEINSGPPAGAFAQVFCPAYGSAQARAVLLFLPSLPGHAREFRARAGRAAPAQRSLIGCLRKPRDVRLQVR